jgi:hypothetical protein
MEIVWTISTCIFCFFLFVESFVETAECAGQDEQPLDLELRLGLPEPEMERDLPLSTNQKEEELKRIIQRLSKKELLDVIGKKSISGPVEEFSE